MIQYLCLRAKSIIDFNLDRINQDKSIDKIEENKSLYWNDTNTSQSANAVVHDNNVQFKGYSQLCKTSLTLGVMSILVLTGCSIDRTAFETAPVYVSRPQGIVTCQLYWTNRVSWDRAIKVPEGMYITTGDSICHTEGLRRRAAAAHS